MKRSLRMSISAALGTVAVGLAMTVGAVVARAAYPVPQTPSWSPASLTGPSDTFAFTGSTTSLSPAVPVTGSVPSGNYGFSGSGPCASTPDNQDDPSEAGTCSVSSTGTFKQ